MAPFYTLIAIASALWLTCIIGSLFVFKWSITKTPHRFWLAFALGLIVVSLSYFGLTHVTFSFSRTVNGSGWRIDSKWFFIASLIAGAIGLGLTLWNRRKWDVSAADPSLKAPTQP